MERPGGRRRNRPGVRSLRLPPASALPAAGTTHDAPLRAGDSRQPRPPCPGLPAAGAEEQRDAPSAGRLLSFEEFVRRVAELEAASDASGPRRWWSGSRSRRAAAPRHGRVRSARGELQLPGGRGRPSARAPPRPPARAPPRWALIGCRGSGGCFREAEVGGEAIWRQRAVRDRRR